MTSFPSLFPNSVTGDLLPQRTQQQSALSTAHPAIRFGQAAASDSVHFGAADSNGPSKATQSFMSVDLTSRKAEAKLRALAAQGADVNFSYHGQGTQLANSLRDQVPTQITKVLLELGADPHYQAERIIVDHRPTPLLQLAAAMANSDTPVSERQQEKLNLLLEQDMTPEQANLRDDAGDRFWYSLAHYLAKAGEAEKLGEFLTKFPEMINADTRYGETPLMYCLKYAEGNSALPVINTLIKLHRDGKPVAWDAEGSLGSYSVMCHAFALGHNSLEVVNRVADAIREFCPDYNWEADQESIRRVLMGAALFRELNSLEAQERTAYYQAVTNFLHP